MATYTTNLNLKKPAQSDKIRIADINNNMDDIDAAFGAIGNDSVATQMGNIQDALAIVSVGDSHAAITAGQYVYVKSHETLDTGLYVASANIAQNGALSSSNLTADTAGGLNALNSKIVKRQDVTNSVTWNTGFTFVVQKCFEHSDYYEITFSATATGFANGAFIVRLPAGVSAMQYNNVCIVDALGIPTGQTGYAGIGANSTDVQLYISGSALTGYILGTLIVRK